MKHLASVIGVVAILAVSGCGDSVPATPSASTAEGLWSGTIGTNRTLTAAVLDDGTYYFFYSAPANPLQIAGVIQGTGTSSDGSFTSDNARDFGVGAATLNATISATYQNRQFLNGTITYAGGAFVAFTSTFNTAYLTIPTLPSVAGFYFGQAGSSGGVQSANINVIGDGTFTGAEINGCAFSGIVAPRIRGNIFNQSVTFGGGACFFGVSSFQGIAFFDLANRRLLATAPNSNRTDAATFFGTRL